jgi:hypothetical protein
MDILGCEPTHSGEGTHSFAKNANEWGTRGIIFLKEVADLKTETCK